MAKQSLQGKKKIIETDIEDSPESIRIINTLKHRADILRKAPPEPGVSGGQTELLEILLGKEKYGIDTSYISGVIPLKELTPLPGVPDYILGLINIRGKILAVFDIKKLFNMPGTEITNLNKVIVLNYKDIELAILADEISGSKQIDLNNIQTNIPYNYENIHDFITGITVENLIVLNMVMLLQNEKIFINDML